MKEQTSWACAALVGPLLLFGLAHAAQAQSAASVEPPPSLQRALTHARSVKTTGIVLSALSGGLIVLGGTLAGTGWGGEGSRQAGFGLGLSGGLLAIPALVTTLYGAGQESGLLRLEGHDQATSRARREERAGIGLFVGGLALATSGCVMAAANIGRFSSSGLYHPNAGGANERVFYAGISLSLLGDLMWLTGIGVWAHGAGLKKGLSESRRALILSPVGVRGRF